MRRWGLWIALMLSLGVNVGVLIMVVANRGGLARLEDPRVDEPLLPYDLTDALPSEQLPLPEEAESPAEGEVEPSAETESQPPAAEPGLPAPVAPPAAEVEPRPAPPSAPPSQPPPPTVAPAPEGPAPQAPPTSPEGGPSAEALRRAEPKLGLLADRLRLRGQQRERFLEAQRRFFTEVTARRVELATLRHELRRQLTSPAPDRQRIRRILARSGEATAELDAAFAENVLTVRRLLGPRQQRAYFLFLERVRSGLESQDRPGRR